MTKNVMLQFLIICFVFTQNTKAQCMLQELSLKEKTQQSALIVEARVISENSFWNREHTRIYTSYILEVYKLFKGVLDASPVNLITEGGTVEYNKHSVQHQLELKVGDMGIFFMEQSHNSKLKNLSSNEAVLVAYGGVQGCIKIDQQSKTASDPFNYYYDLDAQLYPQIMALTGAYSEKGNLGFPEFQTALKADIYISDFSPSEVAAGIESEITIRGSGFGNEKGLNSYVEFKDANTGGIMLIQPLASQYTLWEDDKIIVKVPSRAGTGSLRVRNETVFANSDEELSVTYSRLNAIYNGNAFQTNIINKNSNGGYIWQMNSDFNSNTKASEAFERALISWRCKTYVPWEMGKTTSTNVTASDGINIIRFDNNSELPAGVLAACYTYWNGCNDESGFKWFVNELDIVFDDSTNWSYSQAAPELDQFDLESIALHELGHGHQLGHVINPNGVMHYSVAPGEYKKILKSNDIQGGSLVIESSKSSSYCGKTPIIPLKESDCSGTSAVASVHIDIVGGKNSVCEKAWVSFVAMAENGGASPLFEWKINGINTGSIYSTFTTSTLQNKDTITCVMTSSLPGLSSFPVSSNDLYITVSPKQLPEVIPTADSLTSSLNGISYAWFCNSIQITETKKTIKPVLLGNYAVKIWNDEGCESDKSLVYLYDPLGMENATNLSFSIHPNPSSGVFTIQLNEGNFAFTEITVSNILGQKIYKSHFSNNNKKEINLMGNAEGIYFLNIRSGEKAFAAKIILQQETK
ncbi:MAG: T9SS type A sorting domain-containing protein [Bacteroidetes bacterium]|nr:T9SS type A sorting domain-containing protein [Bacteroidota bacterium]HET6244128.1 T9SS type A sorting domain-containing protein [Bacteroidia bacterium]